ncbi:MAG: NAD(P)/FAD-dependent oxidoreductase [Planctomycetota bacterium]|nr:NAD(P)/FAD-dependent oxidoreductase [Planctomycetota bacterium]
MPADLRFDAVIAGAGPAGSTTALRLARAGFHVALVDHQHFPRFKPCGEFMSPECLTMLDDLGVGGDLRALGAREVRGMVLHGHGRQARGQFADVGAVAAPFEHGWAVRREVFDDVLLRAALRTGGVQLFEGVRATGLLRGDRGQVTGLAARRPCGETIALRAPLTIGADGLRSRIARELGVQRTVPWLDKLALTTRYSGVDWGGSAEVHFFEGGYFACTAVEGGIVSLNLVLDRALYVGAGLPRDAALEAWLSRVPALGERLARGRRVDPVRGIGPLAGRTTQQTFDGAALVGDACGYVDPVTGEGIFFALKGAEMLSQSAIAALHAGRVDRASLRDYARGRRREIVPRVAFASLLQRGLRHPRLVRSALGLLESRPELVDVLVSVTGDYVPLRELARPRVWWSALYPSGGRARRQRASA